MAVRPALAIGPKLPRPSSNSTDLDHFGDAASRSVADGLTDTLNDLM